MKIRLSGFLLTIAVSVALLTALATFWWISGLMLYEFPKTAAEDEAHMNAGIRVIAFIYLVAPVLGGIALLTLLASAVRIFRPHRHRRDVWSAALSAASIAVLAGQIVYLLTR